MHSIKHVFIVGAGTMGSGIAQTCAVSGYSTTMMDIDAGALEQARNTIARSAGKLLQKGHISEAQHTAALNLSTAQSLNDAATADMVIEAASEDGNVKKKIFKELASTAPPTAILASNTSSICITGLAAGLQGPGRVLGLHFFNPVPLMQLVEVIQGEATSQTVINASMAFARSLGKTPILVQDSPGFIGNRILIPMINEAIFTLSEGVAPVESIDKVMKLGMGHPMGPLQLADLIGLDVVLGIMQVLNSEFGGRKYRPAPLLEQMVAEGKLGRKTGLGFYTYS